MARSEAVTSTAQAPSVSRQKSKSRSGREIILGVEVIVHRQLTTVHLSGRISVGPGPAGDRNVGQVLVAGAVAQHVPLGHDREDLPGCHQAEGKEELVVGAAAPHSPRTRLPVRHTIAHAGPTVEGTEGQHGIGLAGQDGAYSLPHHGARGGSAWSHLAPIGEIGKTERLDQIGMPDQVAIAPHDAVDLRRTDPGIGAGLESCLGCQAQVASPRVAGEVRAANTDDGTAVSMTVVSRHLYPLLGTSHPANHRARHLSTISDDDNTAT